jgi:hypothetical protein
MTGSDGLVARDIEAPRARHAPSDEPGWWRHDNGRWVIGEAGRQPEIVPIPSGPRTSVRPDTVIDGGRVEDVVFRAASLRGLAHQQAGTPRQDAYAIRPSRDYGWIAGCVADGVSEGRWSHEAADVVCRKTTAVLAAALSEAGPDVRVESWWPQLAALPWQEAVDRASDAVLAATESAMRALLEQRGDEQRLAELTERPLTYADVRKMMSTTAVVFVVSTAPTAHGTYPAAFAVAAGDSSAYLLAEGFWRPLTAVKNDGAEVASSGVSALPREVTVQPVAHELAPGEVLAVVTDGLGDPLGTGQGVVGRFLATMWSQPPDLLAFAQQAGFYRRSYTDDRTAAVLWIAPH